MLLGSSSKHNPRSIGTAFSMLGRRCGIVAGMAVANQRTVYHTVAGALANGAGTGADSIPIQYSVPDLPLAVRALIPSDGFNDVNVFEQLLQTQGLQERISAIVARLADLETAALDAYMVAPASFPQASPSAAPNWLAPVLASGGRQTPAGKQIADAMNTRTDLQVEADHITSRMSAVLNSVSLSQMGIPSGQVDRFVQAGTAWTEGTGRDAVATLGFLFDGKLDSATVTDFLTSLWYASSDALLGNLDKFGAGQGAQAGIAGALTFLNGTIAAAQADNGFDKGMAVAGAALGAIQVIAAAIPVVGWIVSAAATLAQAALQIAAWIHRKKLADKVRGEKEASKKLLADWGVEYGKTFQDLALTDEAGSLLEYRKQFPRDPNYLLRPSPFTGIRRLYRKEAATPENQFDPIADGAFMDTTYLRPDGVGFVPNLNVCLQGLQTGRVSIVSTTGSELGLEPTLDVVKQMPLLSGSLMPVMNKTGASAYGQIITTPMLLAQIDTSAAAVDAWWGWIFDALDYLITPHTVFLNWLPKSGKPRNLNTGDGDYIASYSHRKSADSVPLAVSSESARAERVKLSYNFAGYSQTNHENSDQLIASDGTWFDVAPFARSAVIPAINVGLNSLVDLLWPQTSRPGVYLKDGTKAPAPYVRGYRVTDGTSNRVTLVKSPPPAGSLFARDTLLNSNFRLYNVTTSGQALAEAHNGDWGAPVPVRNLFDLRQMQANLLRGSMGVPDIGAAVFTLDPYNPRFHWGYGNKAIQREWTQVVTALLQYPGVENEVFLCDVANPQLREQMRDAKWPNGVKRFYATPGTPRSRFMGGNTITALTNRTWDKPSAATSSWVTPAVVGTALAGTSIGLWYATRYWMRKRK